ncbi:MAG: STAS domain-containing protein [Firmicutes bacterium]|nr:STAS domain-containing protein [Bacillota bacterium]
MSDPKVAWNNEELAGLSDVLDAVERHPEIRPQAALPGSAPSPILIPVLREGIARRDLSTFLEAVGERAKGLIQRGASFYDVIQTLFAFSRPLYDALGADHAGDLARLLRAIRAFSRLKEEISHRAGEVFAAQRAQLVEEEQRKIIRELSTPVIPVWDGILVMPLVGLVDSSRAKQMMEHLLNRISLLGSRIVILDVTGVPSVDSAVADHFIRTTRAARLVGARSIIVGISPQVAQAMVRLGVSLEGVETYGDLYSGLQRALSLLGYTVTREPQ